jgi:nitroreductase
MNGIKYSTSVIEIIQRRYSCRKYKNQLLDSKTKENLIEILHFAQNSKNARKHQEKKEKFRTK